MTIQVARYSVSIVSNGTYPSKYQNGYTRKGYDSKDTIKKTSANK